jgi:hypothetical protein
MIKVAVVIIPRTYKMLFSILSRLTPYVDRMSVDSNSLATVFRSVTQSYRDF